MAPCCCCHDIYCFVHRSSPSLDGWSFVDFGAGNYPANVIKVNTDPLTTQTTLLGADYRNKRLIGQFFTGGTARILTWDFSIANRTERFSYTDARNAVFGCCYDWSHDRFYYTKCTSFVNDGFTSTQTFEVRRVNFDGTNDTLLATETWTDEHPSLAGALGLPCWEPNSNTLYYYQQVYDESPRPITLDVNSYAYIKRIDADDGSGGTTVVTLENTTDVVGDAAINGISFSASRDKLVWTQAYSAVTVQDYHLYSADPDGTNKLALAHQQNTVPAQTHIYRTCQVSEKEDRVYFEDRYNISGSTFEAQLRRVEFDATAETTVMGNQQADWTASNRPAINQLRFRLACGHEKTSSNFAGAGTPTV